MKRKTWLIGKSCAGKTYWAKEQKHHDEHVCVINVGSLCRDEFGALNMAKMGNPDHPGETEAFVRAEVRKRLENAEENPDVHSIIIDGMPRSQEQATWMVQNFPGYHRVVWMICPEAMRQERIGQAASDKQLLFYAREPDADGNLLAVLTGIASHEEIGLYVVWSGAQDDQVDPVPFNGTPLAEIFHEHKHLVDMTFGLCDVPFSIDRLIRPLPQSLRPLTAMNPHIVWLQRFLDAARTELDELDELIPKKWWSLATMNLDEAEEELIDVWHFLFSMAMALGMDAEALVAEYRRKNEINQMRIKTGYKG